MCFGTVRWIRGGHIGDPIQPIHGERGVVRERNHLGSVARARPEDRLPILRERIRRKVGDAINALRDPFQLPTLCEPAKTECVMPKERASAAVTKPFFCSASGGNTSMRERTTLTMCDVNIVP